MQEREWSYQETRLKIKSDKKQSIKASIEAALEARREIERLIFRKPEFRTSLEPISLDYENYSGVIKLMLRASQIAEIGPFAAVAGSISQIGTEAGMRVGASNIMIDNGGDISIYGERDFRVGIYAGDSPASGKFALLVDSEDLPIGICTSSSSVGHSVSFGEADAVVITADEASVADAVATAVANKVSGSEIEKSVKKGLDKADDIPEIRGCMIIRDEQVGVVGKIPRILTLQDESIVQPAELSAEYSPIIE